MPAATDPAQLFGPEMLVDPYPLYRKLRETDPVFWSDKFNAWFVTSYDAVATGLNDLRLSSDRCLLFQEMAGNSELEPFFSFLSRRMVLSDPPKHTRLRGFVSSAFLPHAIETMRPHIQQLVDGYLDAAQNMGQMDLVQDLAFPLPATVILEMLGLPSTDLAVLKKWSDDFIIFFSTHPAQITLDQYRAAVRSMNNMVAYFRGALPRIMSDSRPSLIKTMLEAEHQGERMTEDEVFANANLILVAGHETTTNLIGNGTLALLQHPDQLRHLQSNPSTIPAAIDELFRHGTPVQFTNRLAIADVSLGDKIIRRGQFVFLFFAAANRDPAHFPDPDRLDVTRAAHNHLAFGHGHHYCLGAPLARVEAEVVFTTLLRRFPKLRLANDMPVYRDNLNLRGLKTLPVILS